MSYLNIDSDGYLLCVSMLPMVGSIEVDSLDGFDLRRYRIFAHRWDGKKLVLDEKRLAELEAEEKNKQNENRIEELKELLASTDYVAVKIAEGSATKEEYADIIEQRQAWRAEINDLGV